MLLNRSFSVWAIHGLVVTCCIWLTCTHCIVAEWTIKDLYQRVDQNPMDLGLIGQMQIQKKSSSLMRKWLEGRQFWSRGDPMVIGANVVDASR